MTNVVEILVTAKNATAAAFTEAKAGATGMETAMSNLNKVAAVGAVAMAGFLGESVHMASKFDSEMSLLSTQAGVSQDKIAGLSKGVLDLSGKVGQNPDSLAESLFHVESNFESMGITSEKALKMTEVAAKGATVGHADLVDVTNALTAAVASGIPGVENMDQAMGVLNATVGVGDMKMQDLAAAFGSGMVATVKGFGLSITDVGAALAVFGDNNIRGALAGTQLRMSVMALANPIKGSTGALKELGLTQTTLAEDMQKGGLKLALEDLRDRMQKAGISADQQGEVITQAFGRKAGAGLNVLMSQMDRLESKYPALNAGANNFSAAWDQTTHTFAFQVKSLEEKLNALMISVGERLIPRIQALIGFLKDHKDATIAVAEATGVLLTGIMAFSAVSKIVDIFSGFKKVVIDGAAAMADYQLRVIAARDASLAAGKDVSLLGTAFSEMGTKAKLATAATGIGLAIVAISQLEEMGKSAPADIDRLTTSLMQFGRSGEVAGELTKLLGTNLGQLGSDIDKLAGKADGMDKVISFLSFGAAKPADIGKVREQVNSLDEGLANMVKGGHADLAAAAVKKLQDALAAQGKDPGKLTGELHKYGAALGDLDLANKLTADSMGVFGSAAMTTTTQLKAQELTALGLKEAIVDLNSVERGALDAENAFESAIAAGTKALEANGQALHYVNGRLDLTTEKSRLEETALSDLAAKTDAAAEAALKNGGAQADVMAIYDRGRDKLVRLAEAMGLSADNANNLADSILRIPASTDIRVTTTYDERRIQHLNQMAHGGIVGGAATGGARGGLTWVGEQGPELVRLPFGSTVIPSGQSRSMTQSASEGSGSIVLEINSAGSHLDDVLVELLRKTIRVRGGNVQTVLGR